MKVLVTGANSLLGTNTVLQLLKRGLGVRAMVRSRKKLRISDPRIEICLGDITEEEAVYKAVRGCDAVIHTAADTSQASIDYHRYKKVNVEGTAHVLCAANELSIKRVILVSSANAFAFGTLQQPGTEEKPISHPFSRACYARSKFEAQQYALAHLKELTPEVIVVNPTFMLGKFDSKPSSGQIILRGYKKRFIMAPPGGKNFIHVADAADAICNALYAGQPGHCYLLANENLSYKEFYKKLLTITGQHSYIFVLPKFVLLFAGLLGSLLIRLGVSTPAHFVNMQILCIKNYYSNEKAKSALQLRTTPVSEAIEDAIDWFREHDLLKGGKRGET